MLHTETVERATLQLLKSLQQEPILESFSLAGGTALAFEEDGMRLYGMEDIVAMKLSAIADNGSSLKDFVDVAFLSTRFSLGEMLSFYERKFPMSSVIRPLKALTYFDDIDFEENVVMTNRSFEWKRIAWRLSEMVKKQDKVYDVWPLQPKK